MVRRYWPLFLFVISLIFIPKLSFAAGWTSIGFEDRNITSVLVNPKDNQKIVASVTPIKDGSYTFFTSDGGNIWQPTGPAGATCKNITYNPKTPNEIWMSCSAGLFWSNDWGRTFASVSQFSSFRDLKITISIDNVYFLIGQNMYFRSFDGLIWERFGSVDNEYSPTLFINPTKPGEVYLSKVNSAPGLYKSADNGNSWALLNSYAPIRNGVNQMVFYSSGKICISAGTSGIGCSRDGGFTWSDFVSPNSSNPHEFQHFYQLVQNPDSENNVLVLSGSWDGQNEVLYSYKDAISFPETIPVQQQATAISISQGVTYSYASNPGWLKGLWKNDGIAIMPDYLKKYPVIIVPGLMGSWKVNGTWRLDPYFKTYDGLIALLLENGYVVDNNLFLFPYDWRKGNEETAQLLKAKIQEITQKTGSQKVDIIAHSMGGLVAREYAEGDSYKNDINSIFFLGTPHLGSAMAYPIWEAADFSFLEDWRLKMLLGYVLKEEASSNGFKKLDGNLEYIRNSIPSIQELLPIYDYLCSDYVNYRKYPDGYPRNGFLENLEQNSNRLSNNNIKLFGFMPNKSQTINGFAVESVGAGTYWPDGKPLGLSQNFNGGAIYTTGDGIVSDFSGSHLAKEIYYLAMGGHQQIPDYAGLDILKILNPNATVFRTTEAINKYLIIKAYSPVDFYVVSPSGKRIGFNNSGGSFNDVAGAFYSGADSAAEFVTIPNPESGEYKIVTQGNDTGSYKIESSYYDEVVNTIKDAAYVGETSMGSIQTILTNFDASTGNINSRIDDNTPPVTRINFLGQEEKDYYNQNLRVSFAATDDISGVMRTEYSLDGLIWNKYADAVDFSTEGKYDLYFRSIDRAGNTESTQHIVFTIDKSPPEVILQTDKPVYTHWDTAKFSCKATDIISGINNLEVSLDNKPIECKDSQIDLMSYAPGAYVIRFNAEDVAGNLSQGEISFSVVVTQASFIGDLVWLYQNKQISKVNYLQYSVWAGLTQIFDSIGMKSQADRFFQLILRDIENSKKNRNMTEIGYNLIVSDVRYLLNAIH